MIKHIVFALLTIGLTTIPVLSQNDKASQNDRNQKTVSSAPIAANDDFIIGPEDVLQINVWHEPELTSKGSVRPDGKIGIPLLSDVQASGRTTKQLQQEIEQRLSRFLDEPQVSVIVAEIHSQLVHVIGSVGKPGMYPLARPMTIVEILARAGGLVDFAKAKDIRVVRQENGKSREFTFNYARFADGKDLQQNILLRSGDIVVVP